MSQFSLNQEFENLMKATLTEEYQLISNNNNSNNNIKDEDESVKIPDFFQYNNAIKK